MQNTEKQPVNAHTERSFGSNPSLSAFKSLINSRLKIATDQETDETSQPVIAKWEGPFFYEAPTLDKDWFVWLRYRHPHTGQFVRFKYFSGIGDKKTKTDRRIAGRVMMRVIRDLLKEGWSPFDRFGDTSVDPSRPITFMIDQYLDNLDVKPTTEKKYRSELTLFKTWLIRNGLGNLTLPEIKKSMVTNFLEHYKNERGWSGKNYNHYLNDITTFFNYYYDNYDDILLRVPTRSLRRKRVDRPGNKAFNDYQFKKLKDLMLERGDTLLYYFCSFVYYAGLRSVSEARMIKVGDFNFNTKTLRVESGIAKNRRTEYIPLYPEFIELLIELGIDKMNPDLYVFGKTQNKRSLDIDKFQIGAPYPVGLYFFGRRFNLYKDELGLSHRDGIYCYKHTRAVHLGEDGEDPYKIMRLFRHRDLATTMIYMRDLGINLQGDELTKGRRF